ncbi:MAG: RNA methyltransferase [Vampirovibrio sp.]|nr:RNA methyltransferase [Vampirovibrio sp.]
MIPQKIASPNNPTIKQWALLKQPKHRKAQQKGLIEGINALLEALKAGIEIEAILYNPDRFGGLDIVLDHLPDSQNPQLFETTDAALDRLADTASAPPIVAIFNFPQASLVAEESALFPSPQTPKSLLLVLDGLQDPGNVGTLIRSAVAFGCEGVVLGFPAVDVYSPKLIRSSTGFVFRLPIFMVPAEVQTADALKMLKTTSGWDVWLATGHRLAENVAYSTIKSITAPVALVLGSEGEGIRLADEALAGYNLVHIPMEASVESLNVGLSGGILLSHFYGLQST